PDRGLEELATGRRDLARGGGTLGHDPGELPIVQELGADVAIGVEDELRELDVGGELRALPSHSPLVRRQHDPRLLLHGRALQRSPPPQGRAGGWFVARDPSRDAPAQPKAFAALAVFVAIRAILGAMAGREGDTARRREVPMVLLVGSSTGFAE